MKRKTRHILLAAGGAVLALAAASAIFLSTQGGGQASPSGGEEPSPSAEEQQGKEESQTAEWLEKSSSNVQLLAAELCAKNWKTLTNDSLVTFSKDGTFIATKSSGDESEGTWRLDDLKLAGTNTDYRNCTAVITVNGNPYSFTSYTQTETSADSPAGTPVQYIYASCLASGSHLVATEKDAAFALSGIDGDLAPYVGDSTVFTQRFAAECKTLAPLASSARWTRDLKISYDKQMAQATFVCNDRNQTKIYAVFELSGGLFKLSTSSSI